ncbi:hypothetical protein QJS10_CPB13g01689 [Acorus calamus]|uniref:CID domain-containing protein n=1 Tax=Acorus calamus TaxID=4465 RepID=A0AAV9DH77_ACOCL|nr:hypothetical protein QJS10_CPB13g01689 [Acorus calamus]
MEMEGSRRSAAAAAVDPRGPKKSRFLSDAAAPPPASNGSVFPASLSSAGNRNPPFRQREVQQQQELLEQYKTALAELTFNSKPIITNLTIIAGENTRDAKGIAYTICSNILEVPSEQKLPSLYLLDSIVKNIGKDYIKCFAARLPEVFSKAYKQVDPLIHPGMRHLFGTWKGVFPAAPLHVIERELGFADISNGSSSGTTASRPQTQQPAHSIHVNAKYFEARQRLQQSNRVKDISGDSTGSMKTSVDDSERPDKTATSASTGRWTEPPAKIQTIQHYHKDVSDEPVHDLRARISSEKIADRGPEKLWSGPGRDASDIAVNKRNGLDAIHAYGNYHTFRSSEASVQPPPTKGITSRGKVTSGSWKNSEEEEYTWDDMSSRFMDRGGIDNSSLKVNRGHDGVEKTLSSQRGKCIPLGAEASNAKHNVDTFSTMKTSGGEARLPSLRGVDERFSHTRGQKDVGSRFQGENLPDSLSTSQSALARQGSSLWSSQESQPSSNRLDMASRSSGQSEGHLAALGVGLSTNTSSSSKKTGLNQTGISVGAVASRLGSLVNTTHCSADNDHLQNISLPRRSQIPYLPTVSQNFQQPHMLQNLHPPLPQSSQHTQRSSQNCPPQSSIFGIPHSSGYSSGPPAEPSNVLAALMKSGLVGSTTTTGAFQPPLPSGPPPAHLATTSSVSIPRISVLAPSSHGNASSFTGTLPPLPPGPPPPPALLSTSSQTFNTTSVPNPLSALLDNLASKGLITSSSLEVPKVTAPSVPHRLHHEDVEIPPAVISIPVESSSAPTSASPSSTLLPALKVETRVSVGIEFRPQHIREFHPEVIHELFDDQPHQCSTCGFRFKLPEQLSGHMEWHESRKSELNTDDQISRNWYSGLEEWIIGRVGAPFGPVSSISIKDTITPVEENEPMVPADESQSICALCGEIFEDAYSIERDEWMYKGTVYMTRLSVEGNIGKVDEDTEHGPIVHAMCVSRSSLPQLKEDKEYLDQTND